MQMCYLVTLSEFGEGVTFHIVKKNFRVDVDPETFFESEGTALNPPPPPEVDAERTSFNNVVPNVFGGAGLREEIEQLRAEGIEVDDDNEPLPNDAAPTPVEAGVQYEYTVPTFCPRRANNNIMDSPGRWVQFRWDEIAE